MKIKLLNALIAVILFLIPNVIFAQAPTLGTAANFVLFTTVGAVTNSGIPHLTHLTGNVGSNSGSSTGFGNVDGVMHDGDGVSGACAADLLTAYNQLNIAIPTFFPAPLLGNGDTLVPGAYHISSAATLNLNLVLNAQGNPNALFIFQIQGSLATGALSKVTLINGGLACNVFWKVEGLVSMASGTTMRGTIVAHNAAINMSALDTLEGRALSINGAVTTNADVAYMPIGCGSVVLSGPAAPTFVGTAIYGLFSSIGPVTNSGITHVIGDVGTNSGLTTGFNPLFVTGMIHPIPDVSTAAVAADLINVYNYLNGLPANIILLYPAQFGNSLVLTPHTYLLGGATTFTDSLYLNAEGNTNAVFVIQINGALNTSTFSKVLLINGTKAKNVYWLVNGAVHVFDNSSFQGNIISAGAINFNTGASLNGKALTENGAVNISAGDIGAIPDTTCIAPPIGGLMQVCPGDTTRLTDAATGGKWTSSNPGVALIDSNSGLATGILPGTSVITYTTPASCVSTATVTVNSLASPITGPGSVCVGSSITLSNLTPGGTWSSSNISQATAGSSSGIVTGVANGSPTISYLVPGNCPATKTIVVGASSGVITGPSNVCIGSSIVLSDTTAGGIWSSSNPHATVLAGVVTGVSSGIDTVRYTVTDLCGTSTATKAITIDSIANAGLISGPSTVCAGSSITLSDATPGGIWSSSNGKAVVAGGIVTGIAPGIDTVMYTVINGCGTATATKAITVNPLPDEGSISGPSTVCTGSTITLTDGAPGGTWSSSNATATVIGGLVSGVTAGIDTISYAVTNSCGTATATKTIAVLSAPSAGIITGPSNVCIGTSIVLTDPSSGGLWSSTNSNATVVAGTVTGITAGADTILYSVTNLCGTDTAKKNIMVIPFPDAGIVSGPSNVCTGSSIVLSDPAFGGTWSSSNASATVITGVVTGVTAGIDTIGYAVTNSCGTATATKTIAVVATPFAGTITGPSNVCAGSSIVLTDPSFGGLWSSTNSNATVLAGTVTGITAGADTIVYSITNLCGTDSAKKNITISPLPNAGIISGPSNVCTGSTITLTDGASGGIWSSSNATATVIAGLVSGVTAGIDTINYAVTNSCGTDVATKTIVVNQTPDAGIITGPSSVCVGSSITLADAMAGGAWSASNSHAALSGNLALGVFAGIDTIMYTVSTASCTSTATKTITINPLPNAGVINGSSSVCAGSSITLTDPVTGGAWSSSNTRASVVAGLVNGITPGVDTIRYSVTNICGTAVALKIVTVSMLPQVPVISTQAPSAACIGTLYQNFGAATPPQSGTVYNWTATNAAVWAQGTLHQYSLVNFNTTGVATVTLSATVPGSTCSSQATVTIHVGTDIAQTAVVTYFNNHFVCTPSNEGSYQWGYDDVHSLDSTILDGEINQDYRNTNPDLTNKDYWVMTTSGSCLQKTYYRVPTTVQNVSKEPGITVYPNPANATVNVTISSSLSGNITLDVLNMMGQKMSTIQATDNKAIIDVASLPAGMYVINCYNEGTKVASSKFIKN